MPIDAGHLVTSGITETNYTDCGNVYNRYYAVTAVNENGESDPSNENRASESCGSAAALILPVLNVTTLTESGGEPVITKYYFHGGKRVAMDREDVVQWLVGDHLGSTSLVLNANGTVHSEARHYPYGEERWSSGTMPTDYRFTGQRSDSGLGLIHMGARHYDPALGRWLSADTLVPEPGSPQSLNRYMFVLGNPLRFVDPTGMFTEEELVEWGAYTAEELKWLAEQQANWYSYLMHAALGDAFMFIREGAVGIGQFQLADDDRLNIVGAFWTDTAGVQTQGELRAWGVSIGEAAIQTGLLAPEGKICQQWPNPHIQLSDQAAELNAKVVLGIDIASAAIAYFGYGIILADTIAMPMDPAGKLFGYGVTRFGSAVGALSVLDSLVTSGPNSWGLAVSATTWLAGWTPFGPFAPVIQLTYDLYTLNRIEMRNRR